MRDSHCCGPIFSVVAPVQAGASESGKRPSKRPAFKPWPHQTYSAILAPTSLDKSSGTGRSSREMLEHITRRLTAAVLAAGVVLMAWSACGSGALTMSAMMCCAEHHGDCEMAGMGGGSCCGTDQHSNIGMLKPERADNTLAPTTHHSPLANVQSFISSRLLAGVSAESRGLFHDLRRRSHLAHTVLLI